MSQNGRQVHFLNDREVFLNPTKLWLRNDLWLVFLDLYPSSVSLANLPTSLGLFPS